MLRSCSTELRTVGSSRRRAPTDEYEPPRKRTGEMEIPRHIAIDAFGKSASCLACGQQWTGSDLPNLRRERTNYGIQSYLLDSIERHRCDTTAFYAPMQDDIN